jgi:hypothetical protein
MMIPDDLKKLAAIDGPCLSIFQPLRDDFSQVTKSETRLNAAAQKADVLLTEKGFNAADREEFLRPIFKVAENTDWSGRTGSMVVFRAPGLTQVSFWPDTLKLQVHLADEFFILPLLAGVAAQRNSWILTLSIQKIRLFRGTLQGLSEVVLPKGLPRNLADAGGFDKPDHDLESRSAPGAATGQTAPVRSGTSSAHETQRRHLHDFFKMIDRAIQPILAGSADPLILAAVEREIALYREVNTYAALFEQAIHGSPESLGEERLHKTALELIAANPAKTRDQVRREMDAAAGRGLLVTDPAAIHEAAGIGQVERLFLDANPQADENLINATALAVIHNSGTVICSEALGGSGVAAILRYRVAQAPEPELAGSRI